MHLMFYFHSPVNAYEPHYEKYPLFKHAKSIDFDQQAGDLLLIPTGWFHQVCITVHLVQSSPLAAVLKNYVLVLRKNLKQEIFSREPHKKIIFAI